MNPLITYRRIAQVDPTRTTTLRNRFAKEMDKRFRKVRRYIIESIVTNDCFGLKKSEPNTITTMQAASPRAFAFPRSSDKVDGFMGWLEDQNKKYILSGGTEGIRVISRPGRTVVGEGRWTDTYIQSAYQSGIAQARADLRASGKTPLPIEPAMGQSIIRTAFNQPFHADRVGLLYTRTFSGLKGITEEMDKQISNILAQGLAEGKNPRRLAREIADRVDKIGITRARALARTEIVRAHHHAKIMEFKEARLEGVQVRVEWLTGMFAVCPDCAMLQGRVWTDLDQLLSVIPLHPYCKCTAIPAEVGERKSERLGPAEVGDQYKGKKPRGLYKQKTGQSPPSRGLSDTRARETTFVRDKAPAGVKGRSETGWQSVEESKMDSLKDVGIRELDIVGYGKGSKVKFTNAIGRHLTDIHEKHIKLNNLKSEGREVSTLTIQKGKHLVSDRTGKFVGGKYNKSFKEVKLAGGLSPIAKAPLIGEKSWAVGQDFLSVFRHEYGHHVFNSIQHLSKVNPSKVRMLWKSIYDKNMSKVSMYGRTNMDEFFAESFSAYTSPKYVKGSLPKEIENFMSKLIG